MKKTIAIIGFALSVLLFAGCAKQAPKPTVTKATSSLINTQQQSKENDNKFALGPHQGALGIRQYYFSCDSTLLPEKYKKAAAAQAAYLKAHPNAVIELQGYASSAGSVGYSIAISQQRAQSVADYLQLKNVSKQQIKMAAYGSEFAQPYRGEIVNKNCRVDLVYLAV